MSDESGQGGGYKPQTGLGLLVGVLAIIALLGGVYLFVSPVLHCIVAGTLIDTPGGPRAIEQLRRGDRVMTLAPTGQFEEGRVVDSSKHSAARYLRFQFSDGSELRVTAEHPLASNGEWKRAGNIAVGDEITARRGCVKVLSINEIRATVDVYDLTVEPNENFFAGGILVHNKRSRMAANETAAAAACKAYAEAQEIYRRTDYDGDGVMEYAQAAKGKYSLLEKTAGSGDLALIDKSFAGAFDTSANAQPKAGYFFKILTAQGAHAPGGKKSYVDDKGNMVLGYALLAYPAVYDTTGRNTFVISNTGTIYQSDLGEKTPDIARALNEYDPDPKVWIPSE